MNHPSTATLDGFIYLARFLAPLPMAAPWCLANCHRDRDGWMDLDRHRHHCRLLRNK